MIKRAFDFICSALGILILSPLLILIAIWIKTDSQGDVFFRQTRVGRYGIPFRIHKFRTMKNDSESKGRLTIGSDTRVTVSGRFLRKYKLDELPQLIDVLVGNMSIVGPRPEVQEFIDHYPQDVKEKVLSVRPGITDKASIQMVDENVLLEKYADPKSGYIEEILPIKQAHYLEYVDSQSFIGDIKIIFATLSKIIRR